MKYARTDNNGRVVDVLEHDTLTPANLYAPEIATQFAPVPDDVRRGWRRADDGTWSAPAEAEPPAAPEPKGDQHPSPPAFLLLFTPSERVAVRQARATDPVIDDFMTLVEDPRLTQIDLTRKSNREAIDYLTTTEPPLLSTERAEQIKAGLAPE